MTPPTPPSPPRVAAWLLARCLSAYDRDAVLGDLAETYLDLCQRRGVRAARQWYRSQVARSVHVFVSRSATAAFAMLKSYLRIAFRQFRRQPLHVAISVGGLAIALACCIVAYLNWDFDRRFDAFHENADRIYRINTVRDMAGTPERWGLTPLPLADHLAELPEVEHAVRILRGRGLVQAQDRGFTERIHFVDEGFLDVFSFPIQQGNARALAAPGQVILSDVLAAKLFPGTDAVGRRIDLTVADTVRTYTVGGVSAPIPLNSSLAFDVLLPYHEALSTYGYAPDDWRRWGYVTFVQLRPGGDIAPVLAEAERLFPLQRAVHPNTPLVGAFAEALPTMARDDKALHNYYLDREAVPRPAVVTPSIMAVLLLLMACFNFVILSVVASGQRFKEIGVRKTMGGRRGQLVRQFLGESYLLCAIALALGFLLAPTFVDAYARLWPFLDLRFDPLSDAPLLAFVGGLLLVTGFVAGVYPALYVSGLEPVRIFRGKQQLGQAGWFTRGLLLMQFGLTLITLTSAFAFARNAVYQETIDVGYDRASTLAVTLHEPTQFVPLREAALAHPDVSVVAGGEEHIGYDWYGVTWKQGDRNLQTNGFDVSPAYADALDLRLTDGRFLTDHASDSHAVVINETFARAMELTEPLGQTLLYSDSTRYTVVGVVEDFYIYGLWNEIQPASFRRAREDRYRFAVVQTARGDPHALRTFLEKAWHEAFPGQPYHAVVQQDVLAEEQLVNTNIRLIFSYLALLTLLIAGAGLFALVSLTLARRTKEIGIRRVLGATRLGVLKLVQSRFLWLVLGAALLAGGASYVLIDMLLGSIFAYYAGPNTWTFAGPILLVFGVTALTVGGQVWRVTRANPVEALRYE